MISFTAGTSNIIRMTTTTASLVVVVDGIDEGQKYLVLRTGI